MGRWLHRSTTRHSFPRCGGCHSIHERHWGPSTIQQISFAIWIVLYLGLIPIFGLYDAYLLPDEPSLYAILVPLALASLAVTAAMVPVHRKLRRALGANVDIKWTGLGVFELHRVFGVVECERCNQPFYAHYSGFKRWEYPGTDEGWQPIWKRCPHCRHVQDSMRLSWTTWFLRRAWAIGMVSLWTVSFTLACIVSFAFSIDLLPFLFLAASPLLLLLAFVLPYSQPRVWQHLAKRFAPDLDRVFRRWNGPRTQETASS